MVVHVGSEEILLPDAVRLAVGGPGGRRAGGAAPVGRAVARRARLGGMVAASTAAVAALGAGLAARLG